MASDGLDKDTKKASCGKLTCPPSWSGATTSILLMGESFTSLDCKGRGKKRSTIMSTAAPIMGMSMTGEREKQLWSSTLLL